MNYAEREVGDFRILAGTKVAPLGGYLPGVAVIRVRGPEAVPERVFFNDDLCKGVGFETTIDAVQHALHVGLELVKQKMAADN
jgi:hypothetical protein